MANAREGKKKAIETNDAAAVNATLAKGADVNFAIEGEPALMRAVDMGHFDAAQSLLQHKANLEVKDKRGLDPLNAAAASGHAALTQLILHYLGDKSISHKIDGLSAFHRACQGETRYHSHTVEMMLSHGASPIAKTDGGHTPYDLASHAGNHKTSTILLRHIENRYPDGYQDEL